MRIEKKTITSKRPPRPPKPRNNNIISGIKEREINNIYSLWSDGFIDGDNAMEIIGKLLRSIEESDI